MPSISRLRVITCKMKQAAFLFLQRVDPPESEAPKHSSASIPLGEITFVDIEWNTQCSDYFKTLTQFCL